MPAVVQMPAGASTHAAGAMQPAQAHQATPPAPPGTSAHTRPEMAPPVAARADVAPPRADGTMLQRTTSAPVTSAQTPPPAAPASTATTAAAASAAALAAGNTLATAPAAPVAVQAQVVEARSGNPMVVADRGQVIARTDIAGTYTGEGPHRRRLQRAGNALPGGLATLLAAFGAQGHTTAGNRDPAAVERELRDSMMQWLFWLLAIIAYGCVAFAIIALMPMGSGPVGNAAPRTATGGFALLGLLCAAAAWLLARRLATRSHD
ncbi:hypothetical protein WCE39_09190 [Luteimonas sp. MJ174]|uniref:hypothetical protein n=1 Tax=Luteimonas sp. MJ174 TaxID=3129237 RepID=UPI0031BBB553